MNFLPKVLALFRRPKPPVTPPSPPLDKEFLEAIAKLPRERYAPRQPSQDPEAPRPGQEQAAA